MGTVLNASKLNQVIETHLRDYQSRCVTNTWRWFRCNKVGNPLIKVPTGGGKTHILAQLIIDALSFRSEKKIRIIVLTQETTLVKQNSVKFKRIAPQVDAGVFSAKLGFRETDNQVIFASIQSIYKRDLGSFDLILIDECHQIPEQGDGMYRSFIANQKSLNPRVRVIGLTATDYRLSSGKLTEGDNRLFSEVAAEVTLEELLDLGFVVPIRYAKTAFTVSMDNVKLKGSEYNLDAAADEMMLDNRTADALNDSIARSYKLNLKKWKVYCSNVAHCWVVHDLLTELGIKCAVVDGKTKQSKRDEILLDYSNGEYTALISCETLLTGFDEPGIDHIINLKPTTSKGRWTQLVGRGMRPNNKGEADEKLECYLSDYTPNTDNLGRADMLDYSSDIIESPKHIKSRVILCKKCGLALNRYDQSCDKCGFSFVYSRILIMTSEAILSQCIKRGIEIPEDLNLVSIKSFDIRPIKKNKDIFLQLRFFGNDAFQKNCLSPRPILSEFIPFNTMDRAFVEYFTSINANDSLDGIMPNELMKKIAMNISLPQAAIVKINGNGFHQAIAYIKPCPFKIKLHWQNSNETVIENILGASSMMR